MAEKPLHDLVLKVPNITGMGSELLLDGVRVKGITHYHLHVGMDTPNRLTVTMLVDSVDAAMKAEVEQEPGVLE